MAARTAYPPLHRHTSRQVSAATAQDALAKFIDDSTTRSHLHPDAILAYDGVHFAQSGPKGGIVLHHLRRIEAGLRGEQLVAESREELKALFADEVELESQDQTPSKTATPKKRETSAEKGEEWTDGETYAHAQEEIDDELGNDTLVGTGEQAVEPVVKPAKAISDKAARKAAKKARNKAQRVEKRKTAAG